MVQHEQQIDEKVLRQRLSAAYEYLLAENDRQGAAKVRELAVKLAQREFTVAFCGHFSAGKSTMINKLIGENLLPSSPIPTSANLVRVRSGEDYAKVIFKNDRPRKYLAPYDYKMVKNYCRDGDAIEAIEISHSASTLPSDTIIMDTPGIDSADDAHRLATESALHIADLILYVMDYNHVQSELNFMFTRELTGAGKAVCLIVNQVDKHSEAELSFAKFSTGVADAFASWGVKPQRIFYTSLRQPEHEHNQYPQLKAFVQQQLDRREELLLTSLLSSLQRVLNEHTAKVQKERAAAAAQAHELLADLSEDRRQELKEEYHSLSAERRTVAAGIKPVEDEFDAGIRKILDNAYLMPFQTRELAEQYLAAQQPNFKVGWLFARRKTAEERTRREQAFLTEVNDKARSQVEWHLREFISRFIRDKHLRSEELTAAAQSLTVACSEAVLQGALKDGASLSGDYVLNYTRDVANEIKLIALRRAAGLKQAVLEELALQYEARRSSLKKKLAGVEQYADALDQLEAAERDVAQAAAAAKNLLYDAKLPDTALAEDIFAPPAEECEIIAGSATAADTQDKLPEVAEPVLAERPPLSQQPEEAAEHQDSAAQLKQAASRLSRTAELIKRLPGFGKLAAELTDKAARLAGRGFTVALFGAFSAGKSSFANALLGAGVLPVSPNPMTAAINRICPTDSEHQHGTVIIKLKSAAVMLEDINNALQCFGLTADSLSAAEAQVSSLTESAGTASAAARTNYAFLQAFRRGYKLFAAQLGEQLTTVVSEFGDYVAQEEKSCFVEWIDLYYDCPLTSQGITLVDTPGADSINARHTGVAFDYIKNSDAILFVTYYNHAFSRADREFLIQLGRVKDAFELDKMFFIINAIDLANDEAEKQTVIEYVGEQLVKYGVRKPQLYPLSSLNALREKLAKTEPQAGMAEFERAFYSFISHDLAGMAAAAADTELTRVQGLLTNLLTSSRADAAEKAQKRRTLTEGQAAAAAVLAAQSPELAAARVEQEVQELVYYIRQRVFFRFNEFFREAFNPAVLRDDGRSLPQALSQSLTELLQELGFDFAQELRATTVRLEQFVKRLLLEYQRDLTQQLRELDREMSFAVFEAAPAEAPEFTPAFTELDHRLFAKALSSFKSPRHFFEQGGNKLMRETVEKLLDKPAAEYLAAEQARLTAAYHAFAVRELERLQQQTAEALGDFYLGQFAALDSGIDASELERIIKAVDELG